MIFKIIFSILFLTIFLFSLIQFILSKKVKSYSQIEKIKLYKTKFPKNSKRFFYLMIIIVVGVTNCIIFNVSFSKEKVSTQGNRLELFFLVDTSLSMLTKDFDGAKNRLEGSQKVIKSIGTKYFGSKFSVVSFDHLAYTDMPLSDDQFAFETAVNTLVTPDVYNAKGSDINKGINELTKRLASTNSKNKKIVLIFTDGEQNLNDTTLENLDQINNKAQVILVGVGTTKGGKVYSYNTDRNKEFPVYDKNFKHAVSKYNAAEMKKLSVVLKAKLYHLESIEKSKELVDKMVSIASGNNSDKKGSEYNSKSYVWIFSILLLPLLIALIFPWYEINKKKELEIWKRSFGIYH